MNNLKLKTEKVKILLDKYVKEYETLDFIDEDPIRFPYLYKQNGYSKNDIEIVGFISAAMAYGKREVFIKKLNLLFDIMNHQPLDFVLNFSESENLQNNKLKNFNYRFSKDVDFIQLILILKELYSSSSLESLFKQGFIQSKSILGMFQYVVDYFYSRVTMDVTKGFYHLLPNPANKSAMKRLNMFLRWFVRDGIVDLGLWNFIDKSMLLIPLDTHVANISRKLGLLTRSANDFQSVIELTEKLKGFNLDDPIKYDFAMFGYGVNN